VNKFPGNKRLMGPHTARRNTGRLVRRALVLAMILLLAGCSTYGVIENEPLQTVTPGSGYSIQSWEESGGSQEDIGIILAFSGGGTRAAALAYGVLLELRDTQVTVDGKQMRLLDQIDRISSVSGGSFTAPPLPI